MHFAQLVILILLILSAFRSLYQDFNGAKAHEPYGFTGAVITVLITALIAWLYWKAGAFSLLFNP